MDLDEDFVVLGLGPLDFLESQNARGTVSVVDNCSYAVAPFTVRTTFPDFCPVSTYFVASTTSARG